MKRLTIIAGILFAFSNLSLSQPQATKKPEKFIEQKNRFLMNAVWSPDGEKIAFTADKYNGIWVSNARGKQIQQLTTDENAGFGFSWSPDGTTILARPVVMENNVFYHQVKTYDTQSGESREIIGSTRKISGLPVWNDNGAEIAVLSDNKTVSFKSGKPALKSAKKTKTLDFGGALISAENPAKPTVKFPQFEGRHVFNAVVSPDGKKVVFQVNGLGLFVANTDGSNLRNLGFAEQASWMPDGKFIIATTVKDDGKIITSGKLSSINIETGESTPLISNQEVIALRPSVSPNGKKVVFDNPLDGSIYILEIK
jgi:Tol biopolymer transport system component